MCLFLNGTSADSGSALISLSPILDRSRVHPIEPAQQMQQRALADAGRADHRDHFAALDRQIQIAQHVQALVPTW